MKSKKSKISKKSAQKKTQKRQLKSYLKMHQNKSTLKACGVLKTCRRAKKIKLKSKKNTNSKSNNGGGLGKNYGNLPKDMKDLVHHFYFGLGETYLHLDDDTRAHIKGFFSSDPFSNLNQASSRSNITLEDLKTNFTNMWLPALVKAEPKGVYFIFADKSVQDFTPDDLKSPKKLQKIFVNMTDTEIRYFFARVYAHNTVLGFHENRIGFKTTDFDFDYDYDDTLFGFDGTHDKIREWGVRWNLNGEPNDKRVFRFGLGVLKEMIRGNNDVELKNIIKGFIDTVEIITDNKKKLHTYKSAENWGKKKGDDFYVDPKSKGDQYGRYFVGTPRYYDEDGNLSQKEEDFDWAEYDEFYDAEYGVISPLENKPEIVSAAAQAAMAPAPAPPPPPPPPPGSPPAPAPPPPPGLPTPIF
jgi:hypothetical protein